MLDLSDGQGRELEAARHASAFGVSRVEMRTYHHGFDVIWVIVDRLTKSSHFLAIQESSSTEKLHDVYVREIFAQHGVPVSIVFDRDVRLNSRFW